MKKIYILILLFNTNLLLAAGQHHDHSNDMDTKKISNAEIINNAGCKNKIFIEVNGLVCDFCARAIEKVFGKKKEVDAINVDLDEGEITILMHNNKTIKNDLLKELITDSGYDVANIKRGCSE